MSILRRMTMIALALAASVATLSAQSGTFGDPAPSRAPIVRSHRLTVTSNVRGAEISIDGVRQRDTAPAVFTLRPGTYTVTVEARGYQPWRIRVTLDSDQTIRAELLPPTATVILDIPPEYLNDQLRDPWRSIDFYVDGRLQRQTRVEVEPGYRTLAVVAGGLRLEAEFYFEAGRTYTVEPVMRLSSSGEADDPRRPPRRWPRRSPRARR
jgi:hypothetical protein